jgi:hypothetical protein
MLSIRLRKKHNHLVYIWTRCLVNTPAQFPYFVWLHRLHGNDAMTNTMKRWQIPALGLPNLALKVCPRTIPKAGEILVEVEAVALNYRDGEVIENVHACLRHGRMRGSTW